MKINLVQIFVAALCLYAASAGAQNYNGTTEAELAVLPTYCVEKLRGSGCDWSCSQKWLPSLGPIIYHLHHYCFALVALGRHYRSGNPVDRGFFLQEAEDNINYMTRITDPAVENSALMPEIYLTKGKVLTLEHRDAEAANAFLHAIQLKPDYADPYAAMADFYIRIENKQDALRILQEGLHQIPTSKSLARRYQELGGKLPLPDAGPAVTAISKPEPQSPVPAETEEKVEEPNPTTTPQTSSPEQASRRESPPEKIGSPSNPWCRFCVDDGSTPAAK